jgi:hypothetical protein
VATLALLRVCRAPPRRRLPVASRRPFILTSFPTSATSVAAPSPTATVSSTSPHWRQQLSHLFK